MISFSQNEDRILEGEHLINTYIASESFSNKLSEDYHISFLTFKIKNRSFLYSLMGDVVHEYEQNDFDFNLVEDYVFSEIDLHISELDMNNSTNITHYTSPPVMSTRAAGDPCQNMDFETGDFTGWELYTGMVNTTAAVMTGEVLVPSAAPDAHHTIVGAGVDAQCGIPRVDPNGGAFSCMLGDGTGTGARAASIRQTFLVSADNAIFTYSFAVVIQNPANHTNGEMPFFVTNAYQQDGTPIACGQFQVISGPGLAAPWQAFAGGFYRDWSTAFIDLSPYIGTNVTIEFITGDCEQTGHYGYAYVDASCSSADLSPGNVLCDADPVTLTAPAGGDAYLWSTGAVTQSIDVNAAGNYQVVVTPFQGPPCNVTLTADITLAPGSPTANFNAQNTACVNENVTFTDASTATNGVAVNFWEWDFGDGSPVSNQADPNHQYAVSGVYNVSLTVGVLVPGGDIDEGCFDEIIHVITVESDPVANFSTLPVCKGTVTQFTDESDDGDGTISLWEWDFTSDNIVDNIIDVNPTNGYVLADHYDATLTVTTLTGCTNSVSKPVIVNPIPVASFSALDVCEGLQMNFSNNSNVSNANGDIIDTWQWDFGDAIGADVIEEPSYTYGAPSVYSVSLTVTSNNGCINTVVNNVEMFADPTADFNFTDECDGVAINFIDASNGNGATIDQWDYDFNNDGVVDYSGSNTSYTYPTAGDYDVNLYIETTDGCYNNIVKQIEIFPNPTSIFTGENVCENNNASFIDNSVGDINAWNWQFGNGGLSNVQNPSELYVSEGVFNVSLTVTTTDNCVNTSSSTVEIYPTPIPQFMTTNVCDGNAVTFTDFSSVSNQITTNTIDTWEWDYGTTPVTSGNGQFVSHIYPQDGSYTITLDVTTNNNCTNSVQVPVTIYPNPVIDFTSPNPDGCTPWCPDFTNNSTINTGTISTYLWDFGNGNASIATAPNQCYENETLQDVYFDVTLTATSDFGCVSTDTEISLVTVYPKPIADFTIDYLSRTIYDPIFIFTNASLLNDYNNWDFSGVGTSSDIDPTFTFTNEDEGVYNVCLAIETIHGCQDTLCKEVTVDGYSNLYVPNSFTPDGDGVNDTFKPGTFGFTSEDYSFMIFDRWGLLIYQTDNINNSWDGTYKGQNSQVDTYVWKLKAKDKFNGKDVNEMGHVNLLK